MQKIDKNNLLATAYKVWLDGLNKHNKNHPEYNSSAGQFYYDIVANLLWIQKGLCAYTEMYLINPNDVKPENWDAGKFKKFGFLGQLDHFDSTLKKNKGWEWNNFFVIHSDVNVKRKRDKKVNSILKPDKENFNPFHFLQYDFSTHNFLPNSEREFSEQEKILEDINILGLNFKPIIDYRKEYITPIIDDVLLGKSTIAQSRIKLTKFYTAFEMSLSELKLI